MRWIAISFLALLGLLIVIAPKNQPESRPSSEIHASEIPVTRQDFIARKQAQLDNAKLGLVLSIKEPDALIFTGMGQNSGEEFLLGQRLIGNLETWHERYQFNSFVFAASNGDACIA
ncbi:MAG TPA: hypothetical protein VFZ08_07810 [Terriglobia bacterium]|nr:hypothetical protein [Terriglobia bacterium]